MSRTTFPTVALALLLGTLAVPGVAGAAGCEVMTDVRERADCVARAEARDAARAEVDRRTTEAAGRPGGSTLDDALRDRTEAADPDRLLEPRPIAAVAGLLVFFLMVRSRWRRRRAGARPPT